MLKLALSWAIRLFEYVSLIFWYTALSNEEENLDLHDLQDFLNEDKWNARQSQND